MYIRDFSVAKVTLDKQLQMWICLKDADIIMTDVDISKNKLKSLKVAQVKDEMDDDEADGCDSVCDVVS